MEALTKLHFITDLCEDKEFTEILEQVKILLVYCEGKGLQNKFRVNILKEQIKTPAISNRIITHTHP